MSIISSKQSKKPAFVDPVFVFLILVLVLLILVPANSAAYGFADSRLVPFGKAPASLLAGAGVSFASDLQYWNANCSHGWTTKSACENISARAQSCSISADSVYCAEYRSYLQDYLDN